MYIYIQLYTSVYVNVYINICINVQIAGLTNLTMDHPKIDVEPIWPTL